MKNRKGHFNCWQSLLLLFLSGCTMGPRYEPPVMNIPEEWQTIPPEQNESPSLENFIWWQSLNDPVLDDLIQRAAQQNLDLSIASTRIMEARTALKGKKGELYPRLDGSLTAGHFYTGNQHLIREFVGCSSDHSHSGKRNLNFFEAGFDASWEIDLFGAVKHEVSASQAKLESVEESYRDAWITLSAEVARNYIEMRSLQQKRNLLMENIASQKDSISLANELSSIGFSSALDLLEAEEQLTAFEAQRPIADLSIEKSLHRLAILLGDVPGSLNCELSVPGNLPRLPCQQPIGLPSELLRRRPDIRQAERELAASTELVGAAVASLFPGSPSQDL